MRISYCVTMMFVICAAGSAMAAQDSPRGEADSMTMQISSTAFANEATIPRKHTCDGEDVSPDLAWTGAPEKTKSFAMICDDPDAPGKTWVHWVIFNIPASQLSVPANVPKTDTVVGGIRQGKNDFRKTGYGGPCPPSGKPHRYYFKL